MSAPSPASGSRLRLRRAAAGACVGVALAGAPRALPAQDAAGVAIGGVVVDSVTGAPLADALVQVVALDDARRTAFSATTDAAGRFRVDSVPAGRRYAIGFYHAAVDALGLQLPPRVLTVEGAPLEVTLSTPSPRAIARLLCPSLSEGDTVGVAAGVVQDADSGRPLGEATVVLVWSELVVDAEGVRHERRQLPARTRADGRYVACGVPADVDVAARAEHGGRASGFVELRVAPMALVRRDFGIGTAAAGPALSGARVTGTVRSADGEPVAGAIVVVVGTGVEGETDARGMFTLAGLPSGTHALEVRRIGFAPARAAVDLAAGREARRDVVIDDRISVLETVRVHAVRPAGMSASGFLERRKTGLGTYLTREEILARVPALTSDVLRRMPGVRMAPVGGGRTWDVRMRGDCRPQVFVDGVRIQNHDTLDAVIVPEQIAALEVYASVAETPAEFRGGNCGTIVIWTGEVVR